MFIFSSRLKHRFPPFFGRRAHWKPPPIVRLSPSSPSSASCGGAIGNVTVGRVVSPGFPGNYSNNLTCHWLLEAPRGHKLHVHFEKVALAEDDDR